MIAAAALAGLILAGCGTLLYLALPGCQPLPGICGWSAAALEGIRRCGMLGATVPNVGNDLLLYQVVGFKKVDNNKRCL